ncbi:MAG: FIVAR domain-containing protein [Clostridia bacterium]|nr:FIVAR domain-containing protein [Clostridia bacterium]
MKKPVSFLIIISMLLSSVLLLIPVGAASEGTPISSEAEFLAMNAGGNYYLTRDITLGSSYSSDFSGSLDGRGHKITLSGVSSAFKRIVGGSISNLDLSANYSISGSADMGALAAVASGSFENINATVNYSVSSGAGTFKHALGGIIGRINGKSSLKNCTASGEISVNTTPKSSSIRYGIGGIVGIIAEAGEVRITDCVNNAKVTSKQYLTSNGGIIGISYGNTQLFVEGCLNYSEISGTTGNHSGTAGICGVADGTHVPTSAAYFKNCRNYASILDLANKNTSAGSHHIGGMVGRSYGMADICFESCVNSGDIASLGGGWASAGGIFGGDMTHGYAWSGDHPGVIKLINCVNTGKISGGMFVGGIGGGVLQHCVNDCQLIISGCSNFGEIESARYAGGIVGQCGEDGFNGLDARSCYNAGKVTGAWTAGGIIGNITDVIGGSYNKISSYLPLVIDNCLNEGEIISSESQSVLNKYAAAGILGNTTRAATIKNCVNTGNIKRLNDSFSSVAHIAPVYKVNNTASGNLCYANSTVPKNSYVNGADIATVDARAGEIKALAAADFRELEKMIERAEGYEQTSVEEGWSELCEALLAVSDIVRRAVSPTEMAEAEALLFEGLDNIRLVGAPDESALGEAIANAKPFVNSESEYTHSSWERFIAAYASAVEIKALDRPTADQLDAARESLLAATDALEKKADMDALRAELEKYADVSFNGYTERSWREFTNALVRLEALSRRDDLSQSEADIAIGNMQKAAEKLMMRIEPDELTAAIDEIEAKYPRDKYTQGSYTALRAAIRDARSAIAENDLDAITAAELLFEIEGRVSWLEERGDASLLNEAIAALPKGDFTKDSRAALDKVIEEIKTAIAPSKIGDLSKGDVDTLLSALESAKQGLVSENESGKNNGNEGGAKPTPDTEGCSGSACASVALAVVLTIGAAFAFQRKTTTGEGRE